MPTQRREPLVRGTGQSSNHYTRRYGQVAQTSYVKSALTVVVTALDGDRKARSYATSTQKVDFMITLVNVEHCTVLQSLLPLTTFVNTETHKYRPLRLVGSSAGGN